jgi:threonine synthase
MCPADVVRVFHERMQAREWDSAANLLSPAIDIRYPATCERFVGLAFLTMNRVYPDGWALTVEETVATGEQVVSRVRVVQDDQTYWCAGFYTVRDGVIVDGIEHWLTEGAEKPPAWRAPYSTPNW